MEDRVKHTQSPLIRRRHLKYWRTVIDTNQLLTVVVSVPFSDILELDLVYLRTNLVQMNELCKVRQATLALLYQSKHFGKISQ